MLNLPCQHSIGLAHEVHMMRKPLEQLKSIGGLKRHIQPKVHFQKLVINNLIWHYCHVEFPFKLFDRAKCFLEINF